MVELFSAGFPVEMQAEVERAAKLMPTATYRDVSFSVSDQMISYIHKGEQIQFPYRIYTREILDSAFAKLDNGQQLILHCIYSRSCDGFVREKHIKSILQADYPDWAIPYIFKVCDEYVMEILMSVYSLLEGKNTDGIKAFCKENQRAFCKSYNRMISYWNEFYRYECYRYKDYIGKKLFIEHFGYTRSMEYR